MSTNDETVIGSKDGTPDGANKEESHVGASPAPPRSSIDDIMWRVRAEVAHRRNGSISDVTFPDVRSDVRSFDLYVPGWKPAVPRLSIKDSYQFSELLAYSDADFIDVIYRAILRRPPDEYGFNLFLRILRSGASTKLAIIKAFLESPEGKAAGVRVEGLDLPALLEKWRNRKLIGPIIAWIHALVRLGKQAERQATLEIVQAREIQELGRLVNEASMYLIQRINSLRVEFSGRVRAAEFEALKNKHADTNFRISRLAKEMADELAEHPDRSAFASIQEETSSALSQLSDLEEEVRAKFQIYERDLSQVKGTADSSEGMVRGLLNRDKQVELEARGLDAFYAAFEDRFRGDRSLVRTRVEPYLSLVREVGAGTSDAPVVDVGCGRGEWLELLRDFGFIGTGIDSNTVFVGDCRGRGLDVTEGDAVEALRKMRDGSAGAITSMHLIEHLPFERAIAMLDEIRRVLRPGGLIILETPNPENLSVGHHLFYMDPTHRNPLPPQSLRWIVEARGFHDVRIERLTLAREMELPPHLSKGKPGAATVNFLLDSLGAAPDYAIVGKRT